jgi:ribosomal protein L11 methyltransferase
MKPASSTLQWSRPIPVKWLDAWLERLAFIPPTRLLVIEKPGVASVRLQAYPESQKQANQLLKNFGGTLRKIKAEDWQKALAPRSPVHIGTKLIVCGDFAQAVSVQVHYPRRLILCIPAAMAFGTGEHATTFLMLRELTVQPSLQQQRLLDIGTGSGILALAARALGAAKVSAFDNDPQALEVSRKNELLNFPQPKIAWQTCDLLRWKSAARYHLITANLFLETLTRYAPRLAKALLPGGTLLASGLLKTQAREAQAAFTKAGLTLHYQRSRGAWVMQRWLAPLA